MPMAARQYVVVMVVKWRHLANSNTHVVVGQITVSNLSVLKQLRYKCKYSA